MIARNAIAVCAAVFALTACTGPNPMTPNFDDALEAHFDAIRTRDLDAFTSHLTTDDTLYTIVQNGHAFTTPEETAAVHADWFNDRDYLWEPQVVRTIVGSDMAMALVRYRMRANAEDEGFETWLIYVFRLEDGQWRIVHDQNTALDFPAFARANGSEP